MRRSNFGSGAMLASLLFVLATAMAGLVVATQPEPEPELQTSLPLARI